MNESELNALAATPGNTMTFVVERTMDAQARDGLHQTISREALAGLSDQMTAWVGTRLLRHHDKTGLGAQRVTVEITVRMNS